MSTRTRRPAKRAPRNFDAVLDEALRQTFPASDPFSVSRFTATESPSRPVDRKAPRIDAGAVADAQRGGRFTS